MAADESLLWAYEPFGDKLCLTCSWQKQSSVLVHMVSELGIDIPVIELDTGLFFRETYDTRAQLVERYGLDLVRPEVISIAEQHKQEGPNLWESDPDRCCHIRKVEPLVEALAPYDAWISGIRRDQSPRRPTTSRGRGRSWRRPRPPTPGSPPPAATSRRAARPRRRCSGRSATRSGSC